jgi:signal transduction histidine kinase
MQIETRVADAIFQMVSEGLSNVVRHTAVRSAQIAIRSEGECCVVDIANPLPDASAGPRPFLPRSMAERAADMGGRIAVDAERNGHTVVTVSIPLRRRAR